ncbi:MAG: methionine biosynthesis protein MetW [Alphaproteobacteria bacterium]|nr:methionine biosynthesis protein MetW [Alphaproteobacteria bacterium]
MNEAPRDPSTDAKSIRHDQQYVADLIEPGARVLDVGCGDGRLLYYLVHNARIDGRGIELSRDGVTACFHLGLSVIQGDAEADLKDYPTDSFDYAILSQTLQTIHDIEGVVGQLLRIGRRAILSFPNFGHWRVRWRLMTTGRAPKTEALPYHWYETPNIRICSILDLLEFCRSQGITVERMIALGDDGTRLASQTSSVGGLSAWLANLRAAQGILMISRGRPQ